ncbi:MAG: hypothetical protein CVU39_06480 [Chloroflexi bacterium HGW-Chloroflexi-10]|nr:MAG: hypothetical protein CVU39_06480 [Chloroflexi bacterium HGW-Chloroflexi-10]
MVSNNVTRLLTAKKIKFTVFELPAEKLGAQKSAEIMQVPVEMVFKTIVIQRNRPGKAVLAVVPGNRSADLKAIAAILNEKKLSLPTEKEAEQITGLQAGGISPLALIQKGFQVLIDESALQFPEIHISGGQRGLNIRLGVKDVVQLTNARLAAISSTEED